MRVLVVDDEYYARKAAIKVLGEIRSDIELADEAESGQEAISRLHAAHYDLVITDVRMAGKDGIELCYYIKEHFSNIAVVILSGYADFDVAREALHLNVKNYLLKPLDKAELQSVLNGILAERGTQRANEAAGVEMLEMAKAFMACLTMNKPSLSYPPNLRQFLGTESHHLIVVQTLLHTDLRERVRVMHEIQTHIANVKLIFYNDLARNEFVIILADAPWDDLLVRKLMEIISSIFTVRFTVGVSESGSGIEALTICYRRAREVMSNRLVDHERIVFFSVEEKGSQYGTYKPIALEKQESLRKTLLSGKVDSAMKMIRNILCETLKDPVSAYHFRNAYKAVANIINECATHNTRVNHLYDINYEDILHRQYVSLDVYDFFHPDEALAYIENTVQLIWGAERDTLNDELHIVSKLNVIIEKEYFSDITLQELAQSRLFVNPSYLSRLIREKTGKTFSELLTQKRMEEAKHLLASGKHSVKDVGYIVGYNKTSYFIEKYKKFYGVTPGIGKKIE